MLGRTLMVALSLPVLVAGSYGLLATSVPEWALTNALQAALHAALAIVSSDIGLAIELETWLIGPAVRFTLAPAGVGLLLAGVLLGPAGRSLLRVHDGRRHALPAAPSLRAVLCPDGRGDPGHAAGAA